MINICYVFYWYLSIIGIIHWINGESKVGGLLPHFFCFQFFSYFHLLSTKKPIESVTLFSSTNFQWKNWSKIRAGSAQTSLPKVRQETPIVLLVEIHKPKNIKMNFSRSFLQIIVEIGDKQALILYSTYWKHNQRRKIEN